MYRKKWLRAKIFASGKPALNVHGEYSKYEAIREYKALKAATQSKENLFINGVKFT